MNSKLVLANVSRWVARIGSIVISIFGLILLINVFLAVRTESSVATFLCVYSLYFFGMLAGLATAWRKESLGAAILLALAVLPFILLLLNPSGKLVLLFPISPLFIGLLFLCVFSLYFFGMLAGLATAWRKESLGAAILLAFAVLPFILLLLDPSGKLVLLFPISQFFIGLLFLISWRLRRKPRKMESQEEMPTGEEKREN